MTITAQVTITDVKPVTSIADITPNCRLFYELGHYIVKSKYVKGNVIYEHTEWVREGIFKEVEDIESFLKDSRLNDKSFIEHHNFVYI